MREDAPIRPVGIKYGSLNGLASFLYALILIIAGITSNFSLSLIDYAITITCMWLAMKEYKTSNEGIMSFKKGLGLAFFVALICALIVGITIAGYTMVDDSLIQAGVDAAEQSFEMMEGWGVNIPDEAREQALEDARNQTPFGIGINIFFGTILINFIIGLIMAAIHKKSEVFEM